MVVTGGQGEDWQIPSSSTIASRALGRGKVSCTVYPCGPQTRWAGGTVKLASKLNLRKSSVTEERSAHAISRDIA